MVASVPSLRPYITFHPSAVIARLPHQRASAPRTQSRIVCLNAVRDVPYLEPNINFNPFSIMHSAELASAQAEELRIARKIDGLRRIARELAS